MSKSRRGRGQKVETISISVATEVCANFVLQLGQKQLDSTGFGVNPALKKKNSFCLPGWSVYMLVTSPEIRGLFCVNKQYTIGKCDQEFFWFAKW